MSSNFIAKKILDTYASLSNTDKRIGDYILHNQALIPYKTLSQVAAETDSSEPSVMRFIKKIGIESFVEFKRVLLVADLNLKAKANQHETTVNNQQCMVKEGPLFEQIQEMVINRYIDSLNGTLQMINSSDLNRAVDALNRAITINIYGVGYSGTIATDLMYRFVKIGLDCRAYCDESWYRIMRPHITENDVAIGISYSGESIAVIRAMQYAKEARATTIAITGFLDSKLAKCADIIFCTPKENADWAAYSMLTSITHTAICDMLFLGVLNSDWNRYAKEWEKFSTMTAQGQNDPDDSAK